MPFRFSRRIRLFPGFRLNLSKGGMSYSLGRPGAWLTFGHGRVRETVGLPGTGLSWYQQGPLSRMARHPLVWLLVVVLVVWVVSALAGH